MKYWVLKYGNVRVFLDTRDKNNPFHQILRTLQNIFQFGELHPAHNLVYPIRYCLRPRFQVSKAVLSHTNRQLLCARQEEQRSVSAIFSDAMKNAIYTSIDPSSCFSLSNVRIVVTGGAKRLKHPYSNFGFQAESDNALVI